jgi:hypothetical protein
MKRIAFVCLPALLLLCNIAYAQNIEVMEISEDYASAVLVDRDTKTQWTVVVGDQIEEWEIIEIDEFGVTIKKEPVDDEPYAIVHKLGKMSKFEFSFER